MHVRSAVLVGMLCLFAAVASADISRISPSSFTPSGEDFITVFGSGFIGTGGTFVVYDGQITVEPQSATDTQVVAWVPTEVLLVEGQHTIAIQSVDATGVRTHGPVNFTIVSPPLTGPPFLNTPEAVIAEADNSEGASVTFDVTAASQDGTPLTPTCTRESGSHFNLGTSSVQCSASDSYGTTTATFLVIVTDTTPPVLTLPDDITTENPVVTFTATAVDAIDGTVPVACSPSSGSTFPNGTTKVRCVARDTRFNETIGIFTVHVTSGPPVLILPDDIVAEATSAAGAAVTYDVSVDGESIPVTCDHASGSTFALGATVVTCHATNTFGTSTGTFNVTVEDTTAPVLTVPSQVVAEATSAAGAIVTFVATAHDAVDGDRPVSCDPVSGSQFPLGTTTVVCTTADTRLNDTSATFDVIVQDTTPPAIVNVSATPNVLWPPNHRMVGVTVTATAVDAVDPSPSAPHIVSVTSNQPINGTGDGDTAPDWSITGPLTVDLRAERAQGNERIYTITLQSTDASGNVGSATVQVSVKPTKTRAVH